jgi:sterol desaturase/sphingolipid hydroxylase (fatty acid hydroxylase superfamily)
MSGISTIWSSAVDALAQHALAPMLGALGVPPAVTDPREVAEYFLLTIVQVAVIAFVLRPMEKLWPIERQDTPRFRAIDRAYTLIKLFALLPLFSYFVIAWASHLIGGDDGPDSTPLLVSLLPWFGAHPVVLFLVYYAIYDFVYYLIHRLQHGIPWWWALHSLHHSQRELNCWSNDRDQWLDDALEAIIVAAVGVFIGVAPIEYALLVLLGELLQNLDHANIRLRFGPVLEKILVDPRYHRLHHMRTDHARPGLHNCNFAFVFPIWDILFGTALFGEPARPTGVGDPTVDADNEHGIVGQQIRAFQRFWVCVRRRDGWRPSEVSFDEHYRPILVTADSRFPASLAADDNNMSFTSSSATQDAANHATMSEPDRRRA